MSLKEKIILKSGSFELYSEGYLKMTMSNFSEVDLEEAKEREKVFLKLCKNKPMPFVFETRSKLIDYTDEAREYMANNSNMDNIRLAEAFIVDNIGVKLFIKNYLEKNRHKCPSKVFNNEKEALEWIAQFIK